MPFFSIIIPTFNRAELLRKTLASISAQTFTDFEVIVVNDGGNDDSGEIVATFNDPRFCYYYQENRERGAARNFGAGHATGTYFIFFDSDDLMEPTHLAQVHARIGRDDHPQIVFSGFRVVGEDGGQAYARSFSGILRQKDIWFGNHMGCSAVTLSRGLFQRYRFNEDRRIATLEDWELWLRITAEVNVACIPAVTVRMMNHPARSVLVAEGDEVGERVKLLIKYIEDARCIASARGLLIFRMGAWSYASLVAVTSGNRTLGVRYLRNAVSCHFSIIFHRRFIAILRHLL